MYRVSRKFNFEASHRLLLDYDSPCKNIHGHTYKVEVILQTDTLDNNGMVVDFCKLKDVENGINYSFDHAIILSHKDPLIDKIKELNTKLFILDYCNTTAENLANYFYQLVKRIFIYMDVKIKVWETEKNYAEYTDF